MASKYFKQYFVDSLLSTRDLYAVYSLSNLVLNSEISGISTSDKTLVRLQCPYFCKGSHQNQKLQKMLLIHFHCDVLSERIQSLLNIHEKRNLNET